MAAMQHSNGVCNGVAFESTNRNLIAWKMPMSATLHSYEALNAYIARMYIEDTNRAKLLLCQIK